MIEFKKDVETINRLTRSVLYLLAAKVRFRYLLLFIRFLNSWDSDNRLVKKIVRLFDPNNIRRVSKTQIRSVKVITTGKHGEIMSLNLNEHVDFMYFLNRSFDDTCFNLIKKLGANCTNVFIDVGANIGAIAIPISLYNPVIAFEPIDATFNQLFKNAQLNCPENLILFKSAVVSNETLNYCKEVKLFLNRGNSGATSQFKDWNPGARECEEHSVSAVTLDNCVLPILEEKKWNISLIKIDVEGQELEVLEGANQIIALHRPFIVLEWRIDRLGERASDELADFFHRMTDYTILGLAKHKGNLLPQLLSFERDKIWENIVLVPTEKYELLLTGID